MDLKQIISLHHDGLSNRKIAKLLGIVRNTVNAYMQLFEACDRSLSELKELDDHQLREVFPSHSTIDNRRFDGLMQYFIKKSKSGQRSSRIYLLIPLSAVSASRAKCAQLYPVYGTLSPQIR